MVKRQSNTKAWEALTTQKDEYIIQAGWFENSKYNSKTPIGGIAAVQNYGAVIHQSVTDKQRAYLAAIGFRLKKETKNITIVIPPTHFWENCQTQNAQKWKEQIKKAWASVLLGNIKAENAMEMIGMLIEGDIVKAIKAVNEPPLAKSTIKARINTYKNKKVPQDTGINKRLNSTGEMISSVSHKVTKK